MCGRFVLAASQYQIEHAFEVQLDHYQQRYNIAPGQHIIIVASGLHRRGTLSSLWGLRRHDGSLLINIRSETITTKPHFYRLLQQQRCIIPASGFYEWSKGRASHPYYITAADFPLIGFAGVYLTEPTSNDRQSSARCAIVTRSADDPIAAIHDRMPVVIPTELYDEWLSPNADGAEVLARALSQQSLVWRCLPVSRCVGNVAYDDPALVSPVEERRLPLE
ncbi:MAG: SOS response-associated peptidase [Chlorobi bacterium]|nr:SOS response-associated peptidase [Chlorobiota bacterium]